MEDGVGLEGAVVTEELAIGTFRLYVAALVEITFQHVFRIGRHAQIAGLAFDDRQRRAAQRRHQCELVPRQTHRRGDMIDRMRADDESDRQPLAARHRSTIDRLQVGRGVEIDARLAPSAQHQASDADVGDVARGVAGEIHRSRDVGRAVVAVLQMNRKRGEVGIAFDHLLRRCLLHLRDRLRLAETLEHLGQQTVRRRAERDREARAAGGDVRGELGAAGPREPDGLGIAVMHRRDVAELDRLLHALQFGGRQRFEEAAQPKRVQTHQISTVVAS